MAPKIDYSNLYNKAYVAYGQGNYEEAATIIEPMAQAENYRDNPDVLLLRGHIHLSLQQYQQACEQYQSVLKLSDRQDLRDLAQQGLDRAQQSLGLFEQDHLNQDSSSTIALGDSQLDLNDSYQTEEDSSSDNWDNDDLPEDWESNFQINEEALDWDFNEDDFGEPTIGHDPSANPFDDGGQTTFGPPQKQGSDLTNEDHPFPGHPSPETWQEPMDTDEDMTEFPFADDEDDDHGKTTAQSIPNAGNNTFLVSPKVESSGLDDSHEFAFREDEGRSNLKPSANNWSSYQDSNESSIKGSPSIPSRSSSGQDSFIDNLEALNEEELNNLSQFGLTEIGADLPDSDIFTRSDSMTNSSLGLDTSELLNANTGPATVTWVKPSESVGGDIGEGINKLAKPTVDVTQKPWSAWFMNASVKTKPWMAAGITGAISFLAVLIVGSLGSLGAKPEATPSSAPETEQAAPTPSQGSPILLMALLGGLGGFSSTLAFGLISANQVKQTINDLQAQFDAMYAGDFNVKATVHSEDELGQLSVSFNQLARIILTTTSEAQQRAAETEQAREDLQRQVIRLLDDVEGAARGDLTVEAVVTADVLGAVADAFNLTIQNLREIVGQVKQAAKQVNRGSTDSESFARNNSSDALRMAEELAVTLNSVQVMTESIQRVAENAREAEEVAHTSSVTALKGGEAVERTVAGILGIRETVSDTTRKVKRLAEASQEISKIVALISQIASRTNLLALNASIQAARAGEAGRGFAIVADEVRQLADRSAKSLKEIEQIVLQIQSETGSVMTAMEEGIQQVINLVDTSEQAKTSLEDIIDVSNRINTLVRSITTDTVQQRENSRAVTQVMQSVELTAQEASQESQRVAGSLQNLVAISRDLLSSVERFRVDKNEN